ncbi:MAG: choloylglycine hydrolase family protein [Ruminococcaceae bacterium]|nr:choloylglycine hydrolase family protein [Oscillospiraceae bacterium]
MCTSISMNSGGFCFGRNMDIEFSLPAQTVITPRNYPFSFRGGEVLGEHYALVGTAVVQKGYPLYCDAMNEVGLCMAGLSFPDSVYLRGVKDKKQIAPFELIPWVLGSCADISQAAVLLSNTEIADIPFSDKMPNTPLHWHIADKNGSLTAECTAEGLVVYQNQVGVLTNNPPFPFHAENVRQYVNLTADYPQSRFFGRYELKPFGRGFGAVGLPGDFSPPSRFVRAAFLKHTSVCGEDDDSRIMQLFHVLDNVAMPRGSVITDDGREELTAYSCCMSGNVYYYKTYIDSAVCAVELKNELRCGTELVCYPMSDKMQLRRLN